MFIYTTYVRTVVLICALALPLNGCANVPKKTTSEPAYPSTSTSYPNYTVVIPQGVTSQSTGFYHQLSKGETLYQLSKRYHVDVKTLMSTNNISNPSNLEVGQRIFIPQTATTSMQTATFTSGAGASVDQVERLVGPVKRSSVWQTITVHHSGTKVGGAASFDRDHKRRRMGGLFYHFVIGNGSQSRDGQIEVGFRWKKQVKANRPYDIQICLVGDFSRQHLSQAQYESLVNLIRVLRQQYHISPSGVRRHCDVRGKHTECPGRNFPFSKLLSDI